MLGGLLEKTLRETWRVVLLSSLGLALAMAFFVRILPQFQEGLSDIVGQVPFLRTLLSGMMGVDVSDGIAPGMLLVVAWSHPIVLSIVWGLEVVLGTRVPAGEIESGTIDVLLGWPASRSAIHAAETIVWLASGVCLVGCGLLGFQIGAATLPAEIRPPTSRTLLTVLNLLAVYVAVGGTVQCIAAACDRRGKAMGLAVAFLLASFLVQFLSTLWEPARRVAAVSFAHYYRPAQTMLGGATPWVDILVLLVWGGLFWGAGLLVWRRRSVLTI